MLDDGSVSAELEGGTLLRKYKLAIKAMATTALAKIIRGFTFDCGSGAFLLTFFWLVFWFLGLRGDLRSFERFPGVFGVLDRAELDLVVLGLAKSCVIFWFTSLRVR